MLHCLTLADPQPGCCLLGLCSLATCCSTAHSVLCTTATCESVSRACSGAPRRCGRLGAAGHEADQPGPRAVRSRLDAAQLLRYQVVGQSGEAKLEESVDVNGRLWSKAQLSAAAAWV